MKRKLPLWARCLLAILFTEVIIARFNNRRRGADYYVVYALTGTDGAVYRSLEQSEATRRAALPTRIALTAGLTGAVCALIIFDDKKRKRAKEESP